MEPQEQNDPVWKLLSHAKKTEPTPFFARNVVREVRLLESNGGPFWIRLTRWFSSRPFILGTAGCAALVITLMVISESPYSAPKLTGYDSGLVNSSLVEGVSLSFDPASEMASIEYLGQLMAVADPGQIDDAALADLFY